MTAEEARHIAEEYARSVPDDIHVPTLARMIEEHGIAILNDKETLASISLKPGRDRVVRS
jgi:hypothetical protein